MNSCAVLLVVVFGSLLATLSAAQGQVDRELWGFGNNCYGQLGLFDPTQPNKLLSGVKSYSQSQHGMAVQNDGTVLGWGLNNFGQMGLNDSTTQSYSFPTKISTLPKLVEQVSVGNYHTVALTTDHEVWAWGKNDRGQLGVGFVNVLTPQNVTELAGKGVVKVFAIGMSSFAVTSTGALYAWGDNKMGQIGLPTSSDKYYYPTLVIENGVSYVAGGDAHTFVVMENETIYCMGDNSKGQLGLGSFDSQDTMIENTMIENLGTISKIVAGGNMTFVLLDDHSLYSFGSNEVGQLGLGSNQTEFNTPTSVSDWINLVKDVSAGSKHSLILTTSNFVYGAGNNQYGELGTLESDYERSFVKISEELDSLSVSEIYAGSGVSAVIAGTNRELHIWGHIEYIGMGSYSTVPKKSPYYTPFAFITAGNSFVYAIEDHTGELYGFGNNEQSAITNSSNIRVYVPERAMGMTGRNVTKISVGGDRSSFHTHAFTNDNSLWAWGFNDKGQLGIYAIGPQWKIPMSVNLGDPKPYVDRLISGARHAAAVIASQEDIKGWGSNEKGQLGLGELEGRNSPFSIKSDKKVIDAAAGSYHTLILDKSGMVYCFGDNTYGQCGYDPVVNKTFRSAVYVPIGDNATASAVFAGSFASFVVTDQGLFAFGDNTHGTLGLSTVGIVYVPTLVEINITKASVLDGSKKIMKISSSNFGESGHTLAMSTAGELWVFGKNDIGQLGIGDNVDVFEPVKLEFEKTVLDIATGSDFSVVLTGSRKCIDDCNNRGNCSEVHGVCKCHEKYFGDSCFFINCTGDCNADNKRGQCDYITGTCNCTAQFNGDNCQYVACPDNCSGNGNCNRNTGLCTCFPGYSGDNCASTSEGSSLGKAISIMMTIVIATMSLIFIL